MLSDTLGIYGTLLLILLFNSTQCRNLKNINGNFCFLDV